MRVALRAAPSFVLICFCLAQSLNGLFTRQQLEPQAITGGQVLENAFKAREELKKLDVGYKTAKTTIRVKDKSGKSVAVNRYFVSEKEFVFAVLKRSGNVDFLRARLKRKSVGAYVPEMEDLSCSVAKIGTAIGVGEQFSIDCGDGQEIILATLRAAVPNEPKASEKAISAEFKRVIYSAYYDNLVSPDVVASGRDYIEIPIAEARDELTRLGVKSRAFPEMLITEVFSESKRLIYLAVIEHIDHDEFKVKGPIYTGEKVFVQLALNREDTFKYSKSTVKDKKGRKLEGALCLMQIWPPTYRDMRRAYPEVKLPLSAEDGACSSHRGAIIVAHLVLDDKLKKMPRDFREKFLEDPDTYFIYLAAAYNGGEKRARALYASMKPEKLDDVLEGFYSVFRPGKGNFRTMRGVETWIFIKKFMEVSENFIKDPEKQEVKTEDRPN